MIKMFFLIIVLLILIPIYLCNRLNNESNDLFWSYPIITSFRLLPDDDLMESLLNIIKLHKISAASIITCVGSLKEVNIRLASASLDKPSEYYIESTKHFEIASLVGNLEYTEKDDLATGHLHISLADEKGNMIGGHLMKGCKIYTTAEITIMKLPMLQYTREPCELSGYDELKVIPKKVDYILMIINKLKHISKSVKNFILTQQNRFVFQNSDKNTN